MTAITHYDAHPYSELFPKLGKEELMALRASIEEHGQEEPIVLYQEKILDGRNRYMACYSAGIEPTVTEGHFDTDKEALDYVVLANVTRRHLDASQRAMIAQRFKPEYAALARERRKRKPKSDMVSLPEQNTTARDELGKVFNVSGSYIDRAEAIAEASPEEEVRVLAGETSINAAYNRVVKETVETKAPYVAEYEDWFALDAALTKGTEKLLASNKKPNKAARAKYESAIKRSGKARRAVVKLFRGGK